MPASLPGMSVTKAAELLQTQDKIIRSFPEVASVYGKAGRAQTATDPAPLEMFETVINLKPESEWRAGMTTDKLIAELDKAVQIPGISNAWTMPIKARIDMLSTGIRTPIGIKVFGKDLDEMERLAKEIEAVVKTGARDHQRVRRTHHRRVLSQHRARSRGAGALWARDRRPAGCHRDGAGRRDGDDDRRRTRALRRDGALPAGTALRSATDRQLRSGPHDGRGDDSARAAGQGRSGQGLPRHPHRECAAVRLHLRRHPRPRHRLLRGRGPQGGFRQREVSAGLLRRRGAASSSTWSAPPRS